MKFVENIAKIKKDNYQRAFFFKNLGFLFVDCAFSWYRRRDFLAIFQDGMLGQYIGNEAMKLTLEEGKKIVSDEKNFKEFEDGFREVINETEVYLSKIKNLELITTQDFLDLRELTDKMFSYFEKTEFFFTDGCYEGEMSDLLKKNLFILGDDLKVKARPLLVQLLTTIPYKFTTLVAKRFNLNPEDLKSYSFAELITLMELGKPLNQELLEERKKSYVVYCENGVVSEVEGKDKQIILERFKEPDISRVTEFKGVIASKGKVRSRVRVVLPELDQDYELFAKKLLTLEMNQGEILVTETTSPDFMPLIRKAGGIIANQGGLNSHAAIMSREFKIPCLVGTHNATEVLKTGDFVELDAENGVVRKL